MKNIVFTLRFIPLVMLVTLSWSVSGQTIIKEISSVPSQQSIIRNYMDDVDIVYCDSKDSACFMYVDHATNSVKCTRLPDDVKVNDFEIDQRELYFCGNKLDTGFVGIFDISDYFFGTGTMRHVLLGTTHNSDNITNLKKIDYAYYDSKLHLIMVGEGYHNEAKPTYHDCIVDMWFDAYNATFEYTLEHMGYLSYDDVVVTDHYVVVAGHSIAAIDPLAHCLIPYRKPSTSNSSIFNHYLISGNNATIHVNMTEYAVMGAYNGDDLQVKYMGMDSVATVCDGWVFHSQRRSVIGLYDAPINMPFLRLCFNFPQDTTYNDIAFNRKNRYLYMIPNLDERMYYTMPPYDTIMEVITSDIKWLSIDRKTTDLTMTFSGFNIRDGVTTTMQYDASIISECVDLNYRLPDEIPEWWSYPGVDQIIENGLENVRRTYHNSRIEKIKNICK